MAPQHSRLAMKLLILALALLHYNPQFVSAASPAAKNPTFTARHKAIKSKPSDTTFRKVSEWFKSNRRTIIQFDASIGAAYSTLFILAPGLTLSSFFKYKFDESIIPFLHMSVRMIGINHLGYIAGLLISPEERAIRTATAFLTIGSIFVVYYGQAKLDVRWMFLSCTILTTFMIAIHMLAW